jgi:hypothetical protein
MKSSRPARARQPPPPDRLGVPTTENGGDIELSQNFEI